MPNPETDEITIGSAVRLYPIAKVARTFGITKNAAGRMLKALKIPRIFVAHQSFCLLAALEEALFTILDLGGPGFVAPGSDETRKVTAERRGAATMGDGLLSPEARKARYPRIRDAKAADSTLKKKLVRDMLSQVDIKK